jgi:hypothetical protein
MGDRPVFLRRFTARNDYVCVACSETIPRGDDYYRDSPRMDEWHRGHRARHVCVTCAAGGVDLPQRGRRPAHEGPLPYEPIGDGDVYYSVEASHQGATPVEFLENLFPGLSAPPTSTHIALLGHESARIFDQLARSGDLNALSPRQFEQLLAEALRREGYEAWLTPATRDGGRDVIACKPGSLPLLLVAEAKKMAVVEPLYIRSFAAVRDRDKANVGLLATTGRFSSEARAEAARAWRCQLQLKAGDEFLAWVRQLAAK